MTEKRKMLIVKLSYSQVNLLVNEVRRRYPIEVCGALFGSTTGEEIIIKKIVYMRNTLNSELSFQIDPEEFLTELTRSESEGLTHVGFFHSHPGDVKPSETDLKYMKLWPGSIWLIVSSLNSKIAAYRVLNDELQEAYIKIE